MKSIQTAQIIELPRLNTQLMTIKIIGDSPLISNKWSTKAKKMMLDKQMGKARTSRPKKDPKADYKASLYEHPDGGYAYPGHAFKSSAVNACSQLDGYKKTEIRGAFHVLEDMVKIKGRPRMREDMVRNATGVADIRYRAEFSEWEAEFTVRYNAGKWTAEQILNLINVAGFASGIGDWRPQKNGSFGMYHVASEGEK